jgi:two-component system, OmpR family, response regulator
MSGALGTGPLAVATGEHRNGSADPQLLVVDPVVADTTLAAELGELGVHTTMVASTTDGLVEFGRRQPAAVIIAPDAPGVPPGDFVRTVRRFGSPFVVAVLDPADGHIGDLIVAGGSAAIERPYTALQVWRILDGAKHSFPEPANVTYGPIELDTRCYSVKIHGERIRDLPLKEFELLRTLMRRAPEVIADQEIGQVVWGDGLINGNTVAVHVARLRHRLSGTARIRRIRGRGYSLAVD